MKQMKFLFFGILATIIAASCSKSDPPLPANTVNFQSTALGFDDGEASKDITVTLARAASADVAVSIQLTDSLVTYGTEYTTEPAASNNTLTFTIPAGATTASFKVKKADNVFFNGDEKISFAITGASASVVQGKNVTASLNFSEIISAGTQLTLNGGDGGSAAENSVFLDFSANEQTDVRRDSWDLGFYNGDDFRVILNNTMSNAMAVALNKNDLNAVTASDTVGLALTNAYNPADLAKVDDISGDLSKTVIAQISANDADNKVYIYNRGDGAAHTDGGEGWVKIRIIRKGNGYQLQYADIAATTFKTVDIAKKDTYQFGYISLNSGQQVQVAPAKGRWDIEWTFASYYTAFGSSNIYYPFADLVLINNMDGVQAAEVMTSTVSYDDYNESNIAGTTFKSNRDVIGDKWRTVNQTSATLNTDRFYVVKDAAGNVYKLKFNSFTSPRGKPVIEYKLVKKA